jgi:pyruvate-formate lyase-activating enzyme
MTNLTELHAKIPPVAPKNFCIAPFQSIRQNSYGRNSPCAFGAGDWHHGSLTPEQRWNSAELNQLREDFIDNKRPAACQRCWNEEDAGKLSLRQRQYQYFPNDYENFILTGQWMQGPKTAVFKTSNVCNLACRSCAGWDSNTFLHEGKYYLETYNTRVQFKGRNERYNRFLPIYPPKHMDFSQYENIANNLEKIDFFGGEPFLNTTQFDLLEYLTKNNLSKNITLYYSTNCTYRPSTKLQKLWNKFRKVEIAMSIDGLCEEFEYMRWPGKWNIVQENINYLKNLPLDCELYTMASPTVSILNVWIIDKLINWLESNIGFTYLNMVNSPDYLALHIAPEEVKQEILANVKNKEVHGYINLQPHNYQLWKQFIIWTKRQDLYRKQNFAHVFPDYYKVISSWWNTVNDLSEANFYETHN